MPPEPRPVPPVTPGPSLSIFGLLGMPEVVPGDDLPTLLLEALEATPDALPLREDDVLVVTQKVVSKAEGAIVNLAGIEPRPEIIEFAARWDRDPRQLEVVLREARRVVRMANGVLITETPHGFICANGGVDASNVGPGSGEIVTLLPVDPDASAARIREAVRDRHCRGCAGRDLRLLRATVALGHRRRRDRRVRPPADRGSAGLGGS